MPMDTETARCPSMSGGDAAPATPIPAMSRRRVTLGAAALLGLALMQGCASGERRCIDLVASGQHAKRMKKVPCPAEDTAPAS